MNKLILLALLLSSPLFAETDSAIPVEETVTRDELMPSNEATESPVGSPTVPQASKIDKIPDNNPDPEYQIPLKTKSELEVEGISDSPEKAQTPKSGESKDMPVLTTETPYDFRKINHYANHWIATYGFEGMKYDTPYDFTGVKDSFKPNKQELWGARIGLGKQFYLGKGFFTTTKADVYYNGTLFARSLQAGPKNQEELATIKKTGQVFGTEISQSFGYIFEMKTKNPVMEDWARLTVEPYVEVGAGIAKAYNRLAYHWDTGPTSGSCTECAQEDFRMRVSDQLVNTKWGAGINFTANTGFFLYLKATVNNYDITKRNTQTFRRDNGGTPSTNTASPKNVSIDPIVIYALGGGYKF